MSVLVEARSINVNNVTEASTQPSWAVATLAGGCFWGMEHHFRKQFGSNLKSIKVGYSGGKVIDPKYPEVKKGETGHAEAIQVEFDQNVVSYYDLIYHFFRIHDPTTLNRQQEDVGSQYRSVIFYHDLDQLTIAKKAWENVQSKFDAPIVTELIPAVEFYDAEDYHQDYLEKNPGGWCVHYLRW